ncbi:hypothetical protein IEQ34_019784 [Dendrobium chrysotoxum]|uniref:Legumain prodomain domain-containing protein n=1 Tax=Dendrobium chrysotoxum TaxID=161865 RepID=A0AAV7G8L9_DENCH|nr:hypothetical protein IEQ34_019784 [Dendrobium chrysotoxum]
MLSNIFICKKMMVIYLGSCESGSIFKGLLPEDISIYAKLASNAMERSWGTYCPGDSPSPPLEYRTCLGDLYNISWMEDSDIHNLRTKTLRQQYKLVKTKTSVDNTYNQGSHVMKYGELGINEEKVFLYIGSNPTNDNSTFIEEHNSFPFTPSVVNQRDFHNSPEGSSKKLDAQKELLDIMINRMHVDNSINLIGKLLFGSEKGIYVLSAIFEMHFGSLSQYGMKHMRSIANIYNAGISNETMAKMSTEDYLGDEVNVDNIFVVLLRDKKFIFGGSGKTMLAQEFYVIYLESCKSRSIFEGLLPEDISIYAITASNAVKRSWGTYCPGDMGSDIHNLRTKILRHQYKLVKTRTSIYNTYNQDSHVMQYGELGINEENVFLYISLNPTNDNSTFIEEHNSLPFTPSVVNQRDVDLVYYWHMLGIYYVQIFEMHYGSLSQYGMKHMRSIANICNASINNETMAKDYVGNDVNVDNIFIVLLGDKKSVSGRNGKIIDSGPDDHIFIFYSDHGGAGVLD